MQQCRAFWCQFSGLFHNLDRFGNLIFCILAAMKANEGVAYRYPFALRLIK